MEPPGMQFMLCNKGSVVFTGHVSSIGACLQIFYSCETRSWLTTPSPHWTCLLAIVTLWPESTCTQPPKSGFMNVASTKTTGFPPYRVMLGSTWYHSYNTTICGYRSLCRRWGLFGPRITEIVIWRHMRKTSSFLATIIDSTHLA